MLFEYHNFMITSRILLLPVKKAQILKTQLETSVDDGGQSDNTQENGESGNIQEEDIQQSQEDNIQQSEDTQDDATRRRRTAGGQPDGQSGAQQGGQSVDDTQSGDDIQSVKISQSLPMDVEIF